MGHAVNQAIRALSLRHRARAAALLAPLGLHPGQEALLLELARTGPMIQAQLSDALGVEPPSVTLMTRKLEEAGHVRREPAPTDKRASVVALTDRGRDLAGQVTRLWSALEEETVAGLPAGTVAALPALLAALTANVDPRARQHGVDTPSAAAQHEGMTDQSLFHRLDSVRAEALDHARRAQQLSAERREILQQLIGNGHSQADIAREMGVTRQAVQKMLSA
ncbi:MarR family transcriptional regulator [Dactylosporangium sp. NPDC049742]|uniref:MarR family transcriptional regulator n=1 Tax=Dactylosporangium sp. NPDC049742 TaxID=3154737 RepID=UPI00343B70D6